MVDSASSRTGVLKRYTHFALCYDLRVRTLLRLLPGALERSGADLNDEELRVRLRPGRDVCIPRTSITRVWRVKWPDQGIVRRQRFHPKLHGDQQMLWWTNRSRDNLVAVDVDPPVTAHAWGIPLKLCCMVISLEEPDAFIAEVLNE